MSVNWEKILGEAGIFLFGIDIGCSGGRPHEWAKLGSALHYLGVDPLTAEINRLQNLKEVNSSYIDAFVDFPGVKGCADRETSELFVRTSAFALSESRFDSQKEIYNSGEDVKISNRKISPSDLLLESNSAKVDLLKIDIDGDDYMCLKEFSMLGCLQELLSLQIESQFHGENSEKGNTLWNIGKLANTYNLHLFDLSINRYSRRILPSKFIYDFPAQTERGQALWGDSLFLKDVVRSELKISEIIKLIAIFEIHGFYDCAMEALVIYEEHLSQIIPTQSIKNALVESHNSHEGTLDSKFSLMNSMRQVIKKLKLSLK